MIRQSSSFVNDNVGMLHKSQIAFASGGVSQVTDWISTTPPKRGKGMNDMFVHGGLFQGEG